MAALPGLDLCLWMVLLAVVPGIKPDDNNTSHNEVLCPPDSVTGPGPLDGLCVCDPSKCPVEAPCDPPGVLQRTSATGLPGDCCDRLECLPPTATDTNTTAAPTTPDVDVPETDCPEDSYRLRSVGCHCLPGPCLVKDCPSGSWAKIVRPGTGEPGACCPLYECVTADSNSTCLDNGTLMANGSSWFRADCTRCRCDGGVTFCVPVGRMPQNSSICSPLPPDCTHSSVPAGQCCPVCINTPLELDTPPPPGSCVATVGLLYGKIIPNGGSWQEDDCTTCVCKDGQRQCQAYMCEACANPQYEPGECCPRCNGSIVVTVPSHCPPLDNCSLRCVHGFVRDINGCFTCHCQQDECLLECEHGFAQDAHGNKLCRCDEPKCPPLTGCRKVCPHGYRTNKQGCEVCRCETCKPLDQCTKRCAHGLLVNAHNCVICKCIPHGGHIGGTRQNATDVAVGTPCISDSKMWRDDGETWFDGCRQCYCLSGREMCSLLSCPPVPCANPVYNSSKDCCPSCSGTDLVPSHMVCQGEGRLYKEGETWHLSPCVECVCQSGRALCHAASCPPTPCRRPLPPPPGDCCPVCPPEQLTNYSLSMTCERRQGESMWREGNCVSCLCDTGRPSCFTELCEHQVSCTNALQVKNQCCPICLDVAEPLDSRLCTVDNATYSVGDDWREDECTTCVCIAGGEISCTKLVCSVNCPNPIKKPGVCCHICPENKAFWTSREVVYIVVLALVACALVCLVLYVARQCRLKRHQLKLPNNYGCPPPQYTQYRYMPTYDSPQPPLPTSEKTALTPL